MLELVAQSRAAITLKEENEKLRKAGDEMWEHLNNAKHYAAINGFHYSAVSDAVANWRKVAGGGK